jgi:transcriptional regulator with XRE-family HTH domain
MARARDEAYDQAALKRLAKAVSGNRKAAGKTQEDLAYEAGVSVRHLQNLEAGTLNPGYLTLVAIASALVIPVSDLLEGAETKRRPR